MKKQIQKGLYAFIACIALTAFGLQTARATVFSNPAVITIPNSGTSTPYPSTITVSGMSGTITNVNVTITNITHTFAADVDMLLVAPGGQKYIILSDAGGSTGFLGGPWTFTLSDAGAATMPSGAFTNGSTFKPTNIGAADPFAAPAPGGPYVDPATGGTFSSAFGGASPNGTWGLYVVDDAGGDLGAINGGWSLDITSAVTCPPNSFLYSAVTLPGSNAVVPFSTCNWTGDYNQIDGAVAGQTLTITQTLGPPAWLVFHSGTPGGPIIASGNSPTFSFVNTFTGTIYMHIYTDAITCGIPGGTCMDFQIQCSSCAAANNECAGASSIIPSTSCVPTSGTNVGATQSQPAATCTGFTSSSALDVWYTFNVPATTSYTVSMTGSSGLDGIIQLFSGSCGALASMGCSDATTGGGTESFTATLTPGTYYYRIYGWAGGTGTFTTCVTFAPVGPCTNTPAINCNTNVATSLGTANNFSQTTCDAFASTFGDVQIYTYTPTTSGNNTVTVTSFSGEDDWMDFYYKPVSAGCNATGWTCFGLSTAFASYPETVGSALLTGGTAYYIMVARELYTSTIGIATKNWNISCPVTPPVNDNCSSVTAVTLVNGVPTTFTGTTVGASTSTDEANTLGPQPTVWHKFITTTCTNLHLDYCGTSPAFNDVWIVLSLDCPTSNLVFASNWQQNCGSGNNNWTLNYNNLPAGTYWLPVMGEESGFNTAGPYTLVATAVACPTPPPNDLGCNVVPFPLTVGVPHTFNGNSVGATSTGDGAFSSYPTVWEAIVLPSCATVELNYCATNPAFGNVWLNLALDCNGNSFIGGASFVGCGNGNFIVTFPNVPAGTYWIPIIGEGNDPGFIVTPGPYVLTVNTTACPPPATNQTCATALPIVCGGSVTGNTVGVAPSTFPGCDANPFNNMGVWYVFNTSNPGGGVITITTCDANTHYDTYLKVFTGPCNNLTCVGFNDDDGVCSTGGPAPQPTFLVWKSTFSWTASQGVDYYVFVTGFGNGTGAFQLNTTCALCTSPAIGGTASGPGTSPCTNSQINLTLAGYSGSIQWQVSSNGGVTWTNISGATSDNIFTSFPSLGTYMVRAKVTGGSGCGDSFSNTITYNIVNTADALTATATPNPLCPGAALTLSSTATAAFSTVPGSGTSVLLGDDQVGGPYPVGFAFNFYGTTYTDFYIGSNGFLTFSAGQGSGCCSGGFLPSADGVDNVIAFAWEDLYPPSGGTIEYFTTGPIGSRKLVVNFTGVNHYNNTLYPVTSQVVLYETSNFIDINTTNMPSDGGSHTMGVENASGTVALPVPGRNSQNWSATNDNKHFEPDASPYGYSVSNGAAGGFLSYAWTGPNSYSASGQNPPAINNMVAAGFGTYQVTGTAANGCLANAFVTVTALPSPVPDAQNDGSVCNGHSVNLFGDDFETPVGPPTTYNWTGPGFPVGGSNGQNQSVVVSYPNGPFIYTLTVTNSVGCTATASTTVTVNPNPAVTATVVNAVCAGDMNGEIHASAGGSPGPYFYTGSGALGSNTDGNFIGLGAGTYSITVSDGNNCDTTITRTIIEEDLAFPTITCPPTHIVSANLGVCYATFPEANLGNPITGDNCGVATVDNNVTNVTQYQVGGTYVQWDVYDLSANKSSCQQLVVVVDDQKPHISAMPGNITFTATPADCSPAISWIAPTASDNCSVASFTSNYSPGDEFPEGTTTVTYHAIDINGNDSLASFTVTINTVPLAATVTSPTYLCGYNITCNGGNNGSANTNVSGGCLPYSYLWSNGSVAANPTLLTAGTHTVTITDDNGHVIVKTITLTQPPALSTTLGPDQSYEFSCTCANLNSSTTGGSTCQPYTYLWSTFATTANITVCPTGTTNYTVTVTDINGCTTTDVISVIKPGTQGQLDTYVIMGLGTGNDNIGNNDFIFAGGVGHRLATGSITMSNNSASQAFVAGNNVILGSNVNVNTVYRNTGTIGSGSTVGTIVSPVTVPLTAKVPCFPAFSGGSNVSVANGATMVISPGTYNNITTGNSGSTLKLNAGVYYVNSISTGNGSYIVPNGTAAAKDIMVFVKTTMITGNNNIINGNYYSQGAMSLGNSGGNSNAVYLGSFLGKPVSTGNNQNFTLAAYCYSNLPMCTSRTEAGELSELTTGKFTLFPNPSNGQITIQYVGETGHNINISVLNMMGQVVYERNVFEFTGELQQDFDLKNLDQGVYMIQLRNGNELMNQKFIIGH